MQLGGAIGDFWNYDFYPLYINTFLLSYKIFFFQIFLLLTFAKYFC